MGYPVYMKINGKYVFRRKKNHIYHLFNTTLNQVSYDLLVEGDEANSSCYLK